MYCELILQRPKGGTAMPANIATTAPPRPERLHALDLVRASALLLGVVFHAGLSFYPGPQFWIVADVSRSGAIAATGFILHSFRMATFFLLAGYFGRMIYHRYGAAYFIRSRAKRIALPLVLFWLPVFISIVSVAVWGITKQWNVPAETLPPPPPLSLKTFPLTHLWFLYVLILLYVGALALRGVMATLERKGAARNAETHFVGWVSARGVLPLLLALPVAGLLIRHSGWFGWLGVPTPDTGLVPNLAATGTYALAFGIGWIAQRRADLLAQMTRAWPAHLAIGAALSASLLIAPITDATSGTDRMLAAFAYALMAWCYVFGFIGAALRLFSKAHPVTRYLADSSYWLYIIHLPIVMALQVVVMKWTWPAEAKLAFILVTSVSAMLVSYQLLVRHTPIGWLLNGPRKRRLTASSPTTSPELA